MTNAIEVSGLQKRFGTLLAVDSLSFRVPTGSLFGLIGPNGAGKSTILGCLTGLLDCPAGAVQLLGQPFSPDAVAIKRRIGVMSEDLGLFEYLYPAEFLGIHAGAFGLGQHEASRRTRELVDALGLASHAGSTIAELSAGLKKRLAFAAATITGPDLLFLDEPFESVDPPGVALMKEWLRAYTAAGKTVLMTTHILDVAQGLCDRVLMIAAPGRRVWEGDITAFSAGRTIEIDGVHVSTLEELFMARSGAKGQAPLDWLVGGR
jgi:ABC-2 type transport system ATP-binding protein